VSTASLGATSSSATASAIEGKTSETNKSNGGEVQRAILNLSQVDGFGRTR